MLAGSPSAPYRARLVDPAPMVPSTPFSRNLNVLPLRALVESIRRRPRNPRSESLLQPSVLQVGCTVWDSPTRTILVGLFLKLTALKKLAYASGCYTQDVRGLHRGVRV